MYHSKLKHITKFTVLSASLHKYIILLLDTQPLIKGYCMQRPIHSNVNVYDVGQLHRIDKLLDIHVIPPLANASARTIYKYGITDPRRVLPRRNRDSVTIYYDMFIHTYHVPKS